MNELISLEKIAQWQKLKTAQLEDFRANQLYKLLIALACSASTLLAALPIKSINNCGRLYLARKYE